MALLFWTKRKPVATFDTSKYDVSHSGLGVVIARPKNPTAKQSQGSISLSSRSFRDTGEGRAMTEAERTKFIKDKNSDYTVKKTKQGATYGVRQIIT